MKKKSTCFKQPRQDYIIPIIVVGFFFLLLFIIFPLWFICGTDETAVKFRNTISDHFSNVVSNETVTVPPENPFETSIKFKKIGNGVAIDKESMKNYVGPYSGNKIITNYRITDNKGKYVECADSNDCPWGFCSNAVSGDSGKKFCINFSIKSIDEFRSSYGFIPPSFAFYPYGKANTDYKYYNKGDLSDPTNLVTKGNHICMRACSDTNCAAVQIGVPENCAMEKSDPLGPTKGATHKCGDSSEASCTLFYNSVAASDDAYYELYNRKLPTGRKDYLGEKYYILGQNPEITPSLGFSPNGENTKVKWCPPSMPPPKNYSEDGINQNIFNTVYGANAPCSCSGSDMCEDPNCCKYRELITTEGNLASSPYYNIPINITTGKPCGAVQTGRGCCGICPQSDGSVKYVSCEGELLDESDGVGATWDTAPESSECKNSDDEKSKITCYGEYLVDLVKLGKQDAAVKLSKCNCFFRTRSCVLRGVQPSCSARKVKRGCLGDPPILNTDKINPSGITACDDLTTIPRDFRCEYDDVGKLCTGFPYSCSSESGSLWVKTD